VTALVVACVIGILLAVLESRDSRFIPSPTGVGIGMLVPAAVIFVMFLGGVVEMIWGRRNPRTYGKYLVPLSSGFIAGEAIVAVVVPLLVVIGLVKP
jgi:uncharacterized oligopeptide transporter (OPT) family protein